MKTSAALCALLAGTLGFGSVASAQPWQRDRGPSERHASGDRPGAGPQRQPGPRHIDGRRDDARRFQQPRYAQPRYQAPRYTAPRYQVEQRYHRGGYLPGAYHQQNFYVNDWRAHQLYAPPAGHQWMQVGSDFLLVALATGLIANLLTQ